MMYSYYNSYYSVDSGVGSIILKAFAISLILSLIFGFITLHINEKKGYEGGFAWGFWLGVIGIVVVACRQPEYIPEENDSFEKASYGLGLGSWRCSCGRYNANNISSCVCGCSKRDFRQVQAKQPKTIPSGNTEASKEAETLKEYKELLDQGIIKQEEFDALKKTILVQ